MRFLLVNYEYPPVGAGGGAATQAIGQALVRLGHQVVVLTGRFKGQPIDSEERGVWIHRIPSLRRFIGRARIFEMTSFLASGLIVAPAVLNRNRIEAAIIFFSIPGGPIGLVGRWLCGVPYVVSLRGGDVPGTELSLKWIYRILTPLRRIVLKHSVGIVANSEGLKRMSEAADPFPVRVIPNGIDTDLFVPPKSRPATGVLRILFVGRFHEQKNLPLLLQQIAKLPPGTFALHLVGDGPEEERLRRLAEELGIASVITWYGWLPRADLRNIYQSCDCLVNPSLYEGLPNAVMEAMASGLPVVASDVPGNNELVCDGESGILFSLGNPSALGEALVQLGDESVRLRMGSTARRRALEFSSWESAAQSYVALFDSVMTKS